MRIGRAITLIAFSIPLKQHYCGMASKAGETKYASAWFMLAILPFGLWFMLLIYMLAVLPFPSCTKIDRAVRRLTELYEDWPSFTKIGLGR